jgi:hypothetical protein
MPCQHFDLQFGLIITFSSLASITAGQVFLCRRKFATGNWCPHSVDLRGISDVV